MKQWNFTERQRQNAELFCCEQDLKKVFAEHVPGEADGDNGRSLKISDPAPWNFHIQPGDVRLLSQTAGFQYVAVLENDGWDYLVVPFSRCAFPALDGELKLSRDGGFGLETLQVWNARFIHASQLMRSWIAGRLTDEEMDEIREVRSHFLFDTPLPEAIRERTGTPLSGLTDARREYMAESVRVFAEIDRENREIQASLEKLRETAAKNIEASPAVCFADAPVALAAAGKSFLSNVFDATKLSFGDMLRQLEKGTPAGRQCESFAELDEYSAPRVWKFADCPKKAVSVLFYHRRENRILGMGVADPRSGRIYFQYECIENFNDIPADDVLIFLSK